MAEELPDDDRLDERPRRRRDRDREPGAKSGMSTGAIVGIVIGVLALLMCTCGTPIMIGLLLPAVQKVRESAAKMQSQNNLKQMSLAAYMQQDLGNGVSGPFAQLPGGGPATGHSFRVGLLPYMEQDNIYRQIDLTLPWDSAKNSPATGASIKAFLDPGNPASQGTATPYRMFVGPGALFDGSNKPVNLTAIPDGASNTIFAIAATETVPWAKPQELPYGPGISLPPLGCYPNAGGFNVAFADGSVRFVRSTIPEADLRSLIEAADGRKVIIP